MRAQTVKASADVAALADYACFLGFDVSKDTVAVFDTRTGKGCELPNRPTDLKRFLATYGQDSFAVCEPTGGYEAALLAALLEARIPTHRANTLHAKGFMRSLGKLAKTDAIDAWARRAASPTCWSSTTGLSCAAGCLRRGRGDGACSCTLSIGANRCRTPTSKASTGASATRRPLTSLNLHWFVDLDEARALIEAWRIDHNENRPHSSLGYRTPNEFAVLRAASATGVGSALVGGFAPTPVAAPVR